MIKRVLPVAWTVLTVIMFATGCASDYQPKPINSGPAAQPAGPLVSAAFGRTARLPALEYQPTGSPMQPVSDKVEVYALESMLQPELWEPSECTVAVSELTFDGKPALHMHIPVDYYAGEEKYPIGWPRMYFRIRTPEQVFAQYDQFEFYLYATMSRETPPAATLNVNLNAAQKQASYIRIGRDIPFELGKWIKISKPVSAINAADQMQNIGLNISERDYEHGDKLDFHFAAFQLVRSSHCKVTALTAAPAMLYTGTGIISVSIDVAGPESEGARGVPFALSQGDKLLRLETLPVRRGLQTLELDVTELRLPAGDYELTVFPANPDLRLSVPIKVISSPWEEK